MKLFKIFGKKVVKQPEKKSYNIINNIENVLNQSTRASSSIDVNSVSIQQAINYYKSCAPLAKAVDMIAKGHSRIPIILENKKTREFDKEHEVLDLMNTPNSDVTGTEYQRQIASFYLISGNALVEATGSLNSPPLELFNKSPQFFSIEANNRDGFAEVYRYSGTQGILNYFREELDSRFRYISHSQLNEINHIRNFNPDLSSGNLYGMITMLPIIIEIEQYIRSSNHNLSLLRNGARLSAMLMKEGVLTDKQYQRLKEQMNDNYTGDSNAGKVMLAESGDGKLSLKELSQTNKDMDFKENKSDVRFGIFNHYNIPLPLVSPEHMTMDNYSEARLALYDDAILPLTDFLLEEQTRFILPRYDGLEDWKFSYDPQSITALLLRSNKDIDSKIKSQVLTINEVRELLSYDPTEGGDTIYQPMNLVPLGTDVFSDDEDRDTEITKTAFSKILRNNGYSKNQIEAAIKRHYK